MHKTYLVAARLTEADGSCRPTRMCVHCACFTTALRAVSDFDAMAASAKRAPSRISTELSTSGPIRLTRISVTCQSSGFRLRSVFRLDGEKTDAKVCRDLLQPFIVFDESRNNAKSVGRAPPRCGFVLDNFQNSRKQLANSTDSWMVNTRAMQVGETLCCANFNV